VTPARVHSGRAALCVMALGALCLGAAAAAVDAPGSGVRGDDVWLSGEQVVAALLAVAAFAWGAGGVVKGLRDSATKQGETAQRVEDLEAKVDELAAQLRVMAARIEVLLGEHTNRAHADESGGCPKDKPRHHGRVSGEG